MSQGNVNLGIFQDKKATGKILVRESSGYQVAATEAPSSHRGGVAVFYHKTEDFSLEVLYLHGPNVFIFQLVTGRKRWHVGGVISPLTMPRP